MSQREQKPRESQRRQVTVFFADISGFTAMSELMDPEDVTVTMNACFAMIERIVLQHGGTVDKYIGDAVMALFGAEQALENAARHAVQCSIDIRSAIDQFSRDRSLPKPLSVHIGVNTGLVIAGEVGGDVTRSFSVMGDTVNLASRLEDASERGQIFVGPATYNATRDSFEYKALKPLTLKGKADPVPAFEVLGVKEKTPLPKLGAATRQISSDLVGRDAELAELRRRIARLARGEGAIVSIVGEAGLGKSRLLAEAAKSPELEGMTVCVGRSDPVGSGLRYRPFVGILRDWAEIGESDLDELATQKLGEALRRLGGGTDEVLPFVATLMGLQVAGPSAARLEGVDGDALEKLILKAMNDLLIAIAARAPLIILFEDLHWADLSSVKLLEAMLRLCTEHPIGFLLVYRPSYAETSEQIARAANERFALRHTVVALEPLSEKQSEVLIRNLLKVDNLPHATRELIARRAEGNPFYIEEVLRAMIDQGAIEVRAGRMSVSGKIDSIEIPGTIQEVILSRLEHLDPTVVQVLQIGAVIGPTFHHRLLVALVGDGVDVEPSLALLKERQLIVERESHRTSSPRRRMLFAEREFTFKHALIQDTVYGSLLNRTRKELHRRVANAIETAFADRIDDFLAMLALHYLRCDDLDRAEDYLFRAGEDAARAAASTEALSFFREAYRVYGLIHGEGGDPRRRADLERNIGTALLLAGNLTESRPYFDRALTFLGEKVARSKGEAYRRLATDLLRVLTRVYVLRGRMSKRPSTPELREALSLLYSRAKAESIADPEWFLFDSMYMTGRLTTIDPATVEQSFAQWAGVALLFSYSGLSFAVSRRVAEMAKSMMREDRPGDLLTYHLMNFMRDYFEGVWDRPSGVSDELVEQLMRAGRSFWDLDTFLGMDAYKQLDLGNFEAAQTRWKQICEIVDDYGYRFAETNKVAIPLFTAVAKRRLGEARATVEQYLERPEETLNLIGLGNKAKIQVLQGDVAAGGETLATAEKLLARIQRTTSPFHTGWYRTAKLLHTVKRLEDPIVAADRKQKNVALRDAAAAAKKAAGTAAVLAMIRTETYRLTGTMHWLASSPRKAVAWWEKSVAEGRRLGARPELARSHAEIAFRLEASAGAPAAVGGLSAAEHRNEAQQLFRDLGLDQELASLDEPTAARKVG